MRAAMGVVPVPRALSRKSRRKCDCSRDHFTVPTAVRFAARRLFIGDVDGLQVGA